MNLTLADISAIVEQFSGKTIQGMPTAVVLNFTSLQSLDDDQNSTQIYFGNLSGVLFDNSEVTFRRVTTEPSAQDFPAFSYIGSQANIDNTVSVNINDLMFTYVIGVANIPSDQLTFSGYKFTVA